MRRVCIVFLLVSAAAAQVVPGHYVLELEGDTAVGAAVKQGRKEAAGDRRAAIQAEHQRLAAMLADRGAEVVTTLDTVVNAIVVRVKDEDAAGLASLPGVRRVHPVREAYLELDRALPLHKVPDAWRQIGGQDKAGLGVKIAIIDSGIDHEHPGFQDSSLTAPEGFPKAGREEDLAFTNGKIIVARSYATLVDPAADPAPRDVVGHGTAVAMAAAGVTNKGVLGEITGVAPKAYLGNYKIFAGTGGGRTFDIAILAAINDAVKDGMDVINFSGGVIPAPNPDIDLLVKAVEEASAAGVVFVKSAGNEGPDPGTITSPGAAPSVIAVGASFTDRVLVPGLARVEGLPYAALPGNGANPTEPMSGQMIDVATLGQAGLACNSLPAGSLAGKIAFILRGECFFEVKLTNASAAGAVAALLYTDADRPVARMDVGAATIPGLMVVHSDGLRIKRQLAEKPDAAATLIFDIAPLPLDPNEEVDFTSRGPAANLSIKPDLVATGVQITTAAQRSDPDGVVYGPDGYDIVDGTSFSAPLVAGAMAVLKGARPGLSGQHYRSLLINNTTAAVFTPNDPAPVQTAGSGLLNLAEAVAGTVTATPVSVSFGAGSGTADLTRELSIVNVGAADDTFSFSIVPLKAGTAPTLSDTSMLLAPRASKPLALRLNVAGLDPGEYQGFLRILATKTAVETRVAWWYGVTSSTPKFLTLLGNVPSTLAPSGRVDVFARIADTAGVAILDQDPKVTVVSGEGSVVRIDFLHPDIPGFHRVRLQMGPVAGNNVFLFEAGDVRHQVTLRTVRGVN